jgi:hypothetical protein
MCRTIVVLYLQSDTQMLYRLLVGKECHDGYHEVERATRTAARDEVTIHSRLLACILIALHLVLDAMMVG